MISALTRNKEPTILAGDFNARHQKWGYPDADRRGKNLTRALPNKTWQLLNEPHIPTRIGQQQREKDTSPDLTWTRQLKRAEWSIAEDSLGSDHLPIHILLPA